MKKFKLFALTALFCAMGTNAFAALPATGESATKLFTFDFDGTTLEATITGFVSELDAEFKTAVAIPATVTHPSEKDGDGKFYKFDVVGIAENAFANQPISTITFFTPAAGKKGILTIGAGAFAGTNITSLDLSNTKITTVENLFGTVIDPNPANDKVNNKLKSLKLPATWEEIYPSAFANCTALATVNFGTATAATQAIDEYAFAGCPITALDFTGTKVATIPDYLLYDDAKFKGNASLKTVTLTANFTSANLNTSFSKCSALKTVSNLENTSIVALSSNAFYGDAALTTINTTKITSFGMSCFEGCAALTAISLKAATFAIPARAFAGSGLTSVEFPAEGLLQIYDEAFFECANLKKVTFGLTATKTNEIFYIGEKAFAYSGITEFEIPAKTTDLTIGSKAFAGTPIESFTWQTEGGYDGANQVVPGDIFTKCSDVVFYAQQNFIEGWQLNEGAEAPINSTFSPYQKDDSKAFELNAYSTNPKKFYVKWYSETTPIQVKKSEAKVYSGFLEGDESLGLIQHKADENGYVQVGTGEAVIIITNNSELKYLPGDGTSTSWTGLSDPYTSSEVLTNPNALKYCTAATTRGTLETQLTKDSYYIYGWVKAGGFQKITSGTTIPKGTLFAFAKEPAGGRMTIKWYDENGNLEAETTAINGVKAAAETEGQRYNVAGQKVNGSYKGLVIKDGKKYMQK